VSTPDALAARVRAATELLETLAAHASDLDTLSEEDRSRFNRALAHLFAPASSTRRTREGADMTRTGFVLRNLFRKKTRFFLTLLSVITAFLLFGLLQAVNVLFNADPAFIGATRLITQSRVSFTDSLPLSMLPRLEAVPGVERVGWQQWFGGVWQENTQLFTFAVPPARWKELYPEWVMPDEQWQAFRALPLLKNMFEQDFPGIEVLPIDAFPQGNARIGTEETAKLVQESGVDAVIIGNAA
jgi:hypothetical protein